MENLFYKYLDINEINTCFSFAPYYKYLKKKIEGTRDVKLQMLQYIASRIENAGVHERDIATEELQQHKDILDIIYVSLTNITIDGDNDIWGVTAPFLSVFAYGTPSLYHSFIDKETCWLKSEFESNFKQMRVAALKNIYQALLFKLYNIAHPSKDEIIYKYTDSTTGLYQFFKISVNHNFIDIEYSHELPKLNERMIKGITDDELFVRYMIRKLPLVNFKFRGFGVMSIVEITQQHTLAYIKERLWNFRDDDTSANTVLEDLRIALKSLLGTNEIEIGSVPFINLNGRLLRKVSSGLLCDTVPDDQDVLAFFKILETEGKPIIVDDINEKRNWPPLIKKMLRATAYRTYVAIPIFYQQKIFGIMELYSVVPGIITPERIKLLEMLYLELAQVMKIGHEIFENEIRSVISDRFTVIQPSVAWKFDEIALDYIQQKRMYGKVIQNVPIVLESVYPFYGAVDIRNSSLIRNNAIRADWKLQLQCLRKTANALAPFNQPDLQQLMQQQIGFLTDNNKDRPISSETISTSNALDKVLRELLGTLERDMPAAAGIAQTYLEAIEPLTGSCTMNRRNLDISMHQTITAIDGLLDEMNSRMQQVYPAYYDKFRTDGIEYDLYVGQSICPQKPFSEEHLNRLHEIQLEYMRKVALANAAQQYSFLMPLKTTQLIFVNSDMIDITFREDEKRFDVEGAYNVRYQMIKKRIDKVHLLDSDERLTQPGKIAIVYINEMDVEYHKTLLAHQVKKGLFSNLESLQLEELQGVSGLKALRVTVEGY